MPHDQRSGVARYWGTPPEDEDEDEDDEDEDDLGLFDADELGLNPEEDDNYYA